MITIATPLNSRLAQFFHHPALSMVRLLYSSLKSQTPSFWLEAAWLLHSPSFALLKRRSFQLRPLQSVGTLRRTIAMSQLISTLSIKRS